MGNSSRSNGRLNTGEPARPAGDSAPADVRRTFGEAFDEMLAERYAGNDAKLARQIGVTQGAISRARESNPNYVTKLVQKVCDLVHVDADELVFRKRIVDVTPEPEPKPEPVAPPPAAPPGQLSPGDLAEAGAYLALLGTPAGELVRGIVRHLYDEMRAKQQAKAHSGNP